MSVGFNLKLVSGMCVSSVRGLLHGLFYNPLSLLNKSYAVTFM